jgi:excinuclease ABC subunit C
MYKNFPLTPGVYLMKDGAGKILYVGKAGNLRRRVSSYFLRPHDARIQELVRQIKKIDYHETDTTIEALILEAELIKKYSPPFNIREKDDKSFLYVEFTKEKFPRVLLVRGKSEAHGKRFGPFTSATSARVALKILRRIFPYSTHLPASTSERTKELKPCFDFQIGLCPGTCIGAISAKDYRANITNLGLFFEGKKKRIIKSLEKQMAVASKNLDFEKAEKSKRQLFALEHIQDVALLSKDEFEGDAAQEGYRIEGYDISNISGTSAVGSMVVFVNGRPDADEYRKFKIETIKGANDVGMLREVFTRRFKRKDWPLPDLVLVDGGIGQVNVAKAVLLDAGLRIPVRGLAKGPTRKKNDVVGGNIPKWTSLETLVRVRDEAHRFAVGYHKKLRSARFLSL